MNKGKRWNNSENNLLINKIINSNENILNEISLNLGRSKFAVIKQLEKLLLQKNIDINLIYEQVLLTHIKLFFNEAYFIFLDCLFFWTKSTVKSAGFGFCQHRIQLWKSRKLDF